ncbi:hypothetical protein B7494_g903 [Chlorociboria aeruginascens]|nr:hypothetical protein B7494_g903 [Chlorociboria aeruginascens]
MAPSKGEEENIPQLPMPSRNPLPLSSAQEAQVRELYHSRVRFAECALGRTFSAPFKCREQNRAMNSCMISHATQQEQDAAREEWFATRLKRQREREAKEERRKEQEKFHREWWGLPMEDKEGEKGRDIMRRAERVGGFPKRDDGQLIPQPVVASFKMTGGSGFRPSEPLRVIIETNDFETKTSLNLDTLPQVRRSGTERPPLRDPETLDVLIEVNASEGKGFGVFALRDILPGTVILCEAPLVTFSDTGARSDPLDVAVNALPPELRKAYQSLHSFRRKPSESLNRSILYSNGFDVGGLASAIFEIGSRINHSCVSNTIFTWDNEQNRMIFSNRYKLLEGEEITVDYGHSKRYLAKYYGFECTCGGCTDSGSSGESSGAENARTGEMPTIDGVISGRKALEHRSALTPTTAKALIDAGYTVNIERSPERIFDDSEFERVGATLVQENTWRDVPTDHIIIGLKELPVEEFPLKHTHIQFAHCYKQQGGWEKVLSRFPRGGGTLLDLEFLTDDKNRRVAAFGYHAGFAGAALALETWAWQLTHPASEPFPSVSSYPNEDKLIVDVKKAVAIGQRSREKCLESWLSVPWVDWDMAETAKGGPFPEIVESDIFVNCIYLMSKIPNFVDMESLNTPDRKLSVICDVSADTTNPNNPIPVYTVATTFTEPTVPVEVNGGPRLYEYVKAFEQPDLLLPNTWIVVRVDGRGFHRFSDKYAFEKPNDRRALDLMNAAAKAVMTELPDIVIAYGISDEYSFVFHKSCVLFERRSSKLVTTIVSTFTASYVHLWSSFFPEVQLSAPLPGFDGRAVQYPSVQNLRDYMSWRQVDCHINNLYNTTFWALIQIGGLDAREAEKELAGSLAADKNEILFSRFKINYNNEPEIYKKGSVIFRDYELVEPGTPMEVIDEDTAKTVEEKGLSNTQEEKDRKRRAKARITVQHVDIIKDEFWQRRPWLLSNKPGKIPKEI